MKTTPSPCRSDPLDGLTVAECRRLVARIDAAPLFAHAYAHHLGLRFGRIAPGDLLRFAAENGLGGLKIHVEDGEERSLLHMRSGDRRRFGALARDLGLVIDVETSSTAFTDLGAAVEVARDVGAVSVRCYPRYAGRLSEIVPRVIADLRRLDRLDPDHALLFTIEQHEDLKSHELVEIVRAVDDPRLSLLFDFGNMINAHETPEAALMVMAPHVTDVHVKDVRAVPDRGGWAHVACRSGEGDVDLAGLLARLLLLGEDRPRVRAIGLEEEVDYFAPAFRFPDEGPDPLIPPRPPSSTDLPAGVDLEMRLTAERADAIRQIAHVRSLLAELRRGALTRCTANRTVRSDPG